MLQEVEVLAGARRELRRALSCECRLQSSFWDEPVEHRVLDLSPLGMWVEAPFPLELDSPVAIWLTPRRFGAEHSLFLLGRVRRVALRRRASDPPRAGMGIEFVAPTPAEDEVLRVLLKGLPPPLPSAPLPPQRRERIWVGSDVAGLALRP